MSNQNIYTTGLGNISNISSITRLPRLTVQGDSKTEFLVNKADGTNILTVDTVTPLITTNSDLTVNGTLTYTHINILTTTNPEIKLADGNLANTFDIGFYGEYSLNGVTPLYLGLFRDHTDSRWKIYDSLATEPTTTVPGTYTSASMQLANLYSTRCFVGDGSVSNPSYSWTSDTSSGLYRIGTNDYGFAVNGIKQIGITSSGLVLANSLNANSNNITNIATASGTTASFTNLTGTLTTASQPNVTTLAGLSSQGTTGVPNFVYGSLRLVDGGIVMAGALSSINLGGNNSLNNAFGIQLSTGAGTAGQIITSSDTLGHMQWSSLSSLAVSSLTGTSSQILVNGLLTAQTGACTLSFPSSVVMSKLSLSADTTTPALSSTFTANAGNTLIHSMTVSGNKRWQWYVSGSESGANAGSDLVLSCYSDAGARITDPFIITRSTGSLKLSSALDMNSQNINNIATATATTFVGALTGTASGNLALTGGTMAGAIAMGTNNISGIGTASGSTASFTTLTGTLSTAAQGNVTSLGSLTSLRVNGGVGINIAPVATYYETISIDNTNYNALYLGGSSTDNTAVTKSGLKIDCQYKPTNTNGNYYQAQLITPVFASSAAQTLSGALSSIYISDFFTGNAGTLSGVYGIFYDGGGPLAGTITNHFGGYFAIPAAGTNKYALYSGNLAVGNTVVPPTNGIYSAGHIQLASSANIAVNGGTASTTIGLTSSLPITCGAGSTSLNGLALFTDNTTGINFAAGTVNICASGANQVAVTSGGCAVQNGTTFGTSQTNISGDTAHHLMRASGTNRWGMGLQGSESSANAGSNLSFFTYTDAGSFLADALIIRRSDNKMTISGPVSLTTYTNNTDGNISAGSYVPTPTGITNVTTGGCTCGTHRYQRIGDQVSVTGTTTIQSSSGAATSFVFSITLPFSQSNFSGTDDATGGGECWDILNAGRVAITTCGSINATQTLNIATTVFNVAPGTAANEIAVQYRLTYRVR